MVIYCCVTKTQFGHCSIRTSAKKDSSFDGEWHAAICFWLFLKEIYSICTHGLSTESQRSVSALIVDISEFSSCLN